MQKNALLDLYQTISAQNKKILDQSTEIEGLQAESQLKSRDLQKICTEFASLKESENSLRAELEVYLSLKNGPIEISAEDFRQFNQ